MFCKNCGAEINEGAAFCLKCGAKVGLQPEAGSGIATTISGTDCQKDEPYSKMKHVMLSMFLLSIAFFVITALFSNEILIRSLKYSFLFSVTLFPC